MTVLLQGAVLGHPIGHSKSPAMHNAAYDVLGANFNYGAIDVDVFELPALMARVKTEGNWYGLSVTMPLKQAAVGLVDELSPVARVLGAVNTIVVRQDDAGAPMLRGENTDVAGIVNALKHAGAGERPRAAILGGGGTAVSAIAALCQLEATEIVIFVRNPVNAAPTLEVATALGATACLAAFEGAAEALAGFDVVISTLPPHGADELADEFADSTTSVSGSVLLDVAYDPWPSALAKAWENHGGTVVAGIEMLLYQGVEQVKLFAEAGGYGTLATDQVRDVINVMCDAIGVHRRAPHEQNMAG
ncbi:MULTISPECIES: shikimate dehydrogenase [Arthrobacter]|uniref:shikimate dehydrogenase n=1 Tax=unclassified Arthrobacter TaxID=235627 RepID=UPI0024BA37BF|nr:shikimate dehydrogenase [Arthrobacter sp. H35-MC1]MDJ0315922.1 shikimate dehydrogenase [Arthrobacter sp. H35-MC1]